MKVENNPYDFFSLHRVICLEEENTKEENMKVLENKVMSG